MIKTIKKKSLKITKKILVYMLILFIISTYLPPFSSSAASDSFTGAQFDTNIYNSTNDNDIKCRRITNDRTGEQFTVFCAEAYVSFVSVGNSYTATYSTPSKAIIKKACKIAYMRMV